jgi:hypothetical protein
MMKVARTAEVSAVAGEMGLSCGDRWEDIGLCDADRQSKENVLLPNM